MLGLRLAAGNSVRAAYSGRRHAQLLLLAAILLIGCASENSAIAADLKSSTAKFIGGDYSGCITDANAALAERVYGESWPVLKAKAELAIGRYDAARDTVKAGLQRYPWSIQLMLAGHQASLHSGQVEQAAQSLNQILDTVSKSPWRYGDVEDLITIGTAALMKGGDARQVLDGFFDRARTRNPDSRSPYLASGELALDKNDFALAAEIFAEALEKFPKDPDLHFGIVRAVASTDAQRSTIALVKVFEGNPRHVPAMLFQAENLIDSEDYGAAESLIQKVLEVNPHEPRAWAYRAVLAHLANDPKGEDIYREIAQGRWKRNPVVDYLIGRKLSQKYRFAEGAVYQRRALQFDDKFLPARVQLTQDLMRLGQESEGWELADAVHELDGYDVSTFNLLELRDTLTKFATLENDEFVVRMDAREAKIYGDRVLRLLSRVKQTLCEKYGLKLTDKVIVEIFPRESDFSVRTFGMPAVSGFLGVCFGKVITANSPASQADNPSNWEAVLWHEFCHVVTLQLTRNRMPRWLSEGISVYEELQANPTWGQRMTPKYRELILGGELWPIGRLSGAFLSPKSPLHLQFAYYESSLVVEFLVERYGLNSLKAVLADLGAGLDINVSLARQTDDLAKLEEEFERFARKRLDEFAPGADWEPIDPAIIESRDSAALADWIEEHPKNVAGLSTQAQLLIRDSRWEEAKAPLTKLIELCPTDMASANAYELLAEVHQKLGETELEHNVLKKYTALAADALAANLRLIEIDSAAKHWDSVAAGVERAVGVNPLIAQPYQSLAEAAEALGRRDDAIAALNTLLILEPADLAGTHFRLARLLHEKRDPQAKRHVLLALEEAPRFRAAHELLLKINRQ